MTFRVGTVSEMSVVEAPLPIGGLVSKPNSSSSTGNSAMTIPVVASFAEFKSSLREKPCGEEMVSSEAVKNDSSSESYEGSRKEDVFSCPKSVTSKNGVNCGKHLTSVTKLAMPNLQTSICLEKSVQGKEVSVKSKTWGLTLGLEPVGEVFAVAEDLDVDGNTYDLSLTPVLEPPRDRIMRTMSFIPRVDVDSLPLWGFTRIQGRRPEMEDAVAVLPCFQRLPSKFLTGTHALNDLCRSLSQSIHFYGVYDGHGGSQVANYCRDNLHHVLAKEIEAVKSDIQKGYIGEWQEELGRGMYRCFLKVDAAVGEPRQGDASKSEDDVEPIAPDTVGSTAVVAIVSSTHIIVANTGDSRAVLCRGKQPMPLSVDQKPEREDELERIESAGGKVIWWNGYRVLGVLAMSRSIGDRHLKPWVIPDPEVKCVPRTKDDDCLILASDGLWDVMTNEEACDAARRRILLWHKKNGANISQEGRGKDADPAAQAAAEYLTKLALQRESKDNISVVVVDLKPHRKLRTKS